MVTSLLMVSQSSLIRPEDRKGRRNKITRGRFILTASNVLRHQYQSRLLNANQQILSEGFAKRYIHTKDRFPLKRGLTDTNTGVKVEISSRL